MSDICRTCPRSEIVTHPLGDISVICHCWEKKNGKCTCQDAKDAEDYFRITNQGDEES